MSTISAAASKNNPKIIVEKITPVRKGGLAGFATVTIADPAGVYSCRIHSIRIVASPGKPTWVGLPQNEVDSKTPGGKKRYFPIIELLDQPLRESVCVAVLQAYSAQSEPAGTKPTRAIIPPDPFAATDEEVSF